MKVLYHRFGPHLHLQPLFLLAAVTAFLSFAAVAEQDNKAKLTVKPNRCISLHQGQVCYQQVKLSWRTPVDGQYCLYVEQNEAALTCWQGAAQTEYHYTFEGSESTYFEIRPYGETRVLGRVKLQLASVYKTSTRSHSKWRLF